MVRQVALKGLTLNDRAEVEEGDEEEEDSQDEGEEVVELQGTTGDARSQRRFKADTRCESDEDSESGAEDAAINDQSQNDKLSVRLGRVQESVALSGYPYTQALRRLNESKNKYLSEENERVPSEEDYEAARRIDTKNDNIAIALSLA